MTLFVVFVYANLEKQLADLRKAPGLLFGELQEPFFEVCVDAKGQGGIFSHLNAIVGERLRPANNCLDVFAFVV